MCAAVEAAHRRQLIHRDLKPENIFLLRPDGVDKGEETVKVLDFGIAKFLRSCDDAAATRTDFETGAGILVGTMAYMSPEQLLGESPDVSWDLWALAVVAYETLTGALPFATASAGDWRRAVLAGSFTPLARHLKDPPAQWQTFFARCFATNGIERPRFSGGIPAPPGNGSRLLNLEIRGSRFEFKEGETIFGPILIGYPTEQPQAPPKREPIIKWIWD